MTTDGGVKTLEFISGIFGTAHVDTVKRWRRQTPRLKLGVNKEAIFHNVHHVAPGALPFTPWLR